MSRTAIPISRATLERVAALNRKGRHLKDLAADLGISVDTLMARMTEAGLSRRGGSLKEGIPLQEMDTARQAVELYKSGLSFEQVREQLGISKHRARAYVHTLEPDAVRPRSGWGAKRVAPCTSRPYRQRKAADSRPKCRWCEIVLEEAGDAEDAGFCHMCRADFAHVRKQARTATGRAARFYAEYLERWEQAA